MFIKKKKKLHSFERNNISALFIKRESKRADIKISSFCNLADEGRTECISFETSHF